MFEIEWHVPENTTTESPKLMYRFIMPHVDASGSFCPPGQWSDWKQVPIVTTKNLEAQP